MSRKIPWLRVCESADIGKGEHMTLDLMYKGTRQSALVFRYDGHVYAYLNRCVHMGSPLNADQDIIFDDTGRLLRCSMHGIVFDPETGVSRSMMCNGERLQPLALTEEDVGIYMNDKRVSPADQGKPLGLASSRL